MGKKNKRTYKVSLPRKETSLIGTIKGIDIFLRRDGRVNRAMNPEIASYRHKSKKDYDRKKDKINLNKRKDVYK